MKSIIGLLFLMSALLVGCDFHTSNGNAPKKLAILQEKFGVEWPTDYTNAEAGSLSDDRGDSDYAIKLEMPESNYLSWLQSSSNVLKDMGPAIGPIDDPKLETHFTWWDCNSFPASQFHIIGDGLPGTNPKGMLYAFVIVTNKIAVLYIYGSPK